MYNTKFVGYTTCSFLISDIRWNIFKELQAYNNTMYALTKINCNGDKRAWTSNEVSGLTSCHLEIYGRAISYPARHLCPLSFDLTAVLIVPLPCRVEAGFGPMPGHDTGPHGNVAAAVAAAARAAVDGGGSGGGGRRWAVVGGGGGGGGGG